MIIYDRKNKKITKEIEYEQNTLSFLYKTIPGRILLRFVSDPKFSKLRSKYFKSPRSKKEIDAFIKKYNINMTQYNNSYETFNDFFTRKRKVENTLFFDELPAIADSKLLAYKIKDNLRFDIKNTSYSLEELVGKKLDVSGYKNGYALIFRLSVQDCHRYYFPDDGVYRKRYKIKGKLHTIRPIASKYRVFAHNQRVVNLLKTKHLGDIVQIEVGALLVGCINNNPNLSFKKLDEKGYFEYGGSTIILLLKNNVKIDEDILNYSNKHIETKVQIGERIGEII